MRILRLCRRFRGENNFVWGFIFIVFEKVIFRNYFLVLYIRYGY